MLRNKKEPQLRHTTRMDLKVRRLTERKQTKRTYGVTPFMQSSPLGTFNLWWWNLQWQGQRGKGQRGLWGAGRTFLLTWMVVTDTDTCQNSSQCTLTSVHFVRINYTSINTSQQGKTQIPKGSLTTEGKRRGSWWDLTGPLQYLPSHKNLGFQLSLFYREQN